MTLHPRQSIASPPTLFSLENAIEHDESVRARWRSDSKHFRVDAPGPAVPAPASGLAKIEQRLAKHVARLTSRSGLPSCKTKNQRVVFHDHASDLVNRMSQWSLSLDRRESELDGREKELNRRERMLRQSCGSSDSN